MINQTLHAADAAMHSAACSLSILMEALRFPDSSSGTSAIVFSMDFSLILSSGNKHRESIIGERCSDAISKWQFSKKQKKTTQKNQKTLNGFPPSRCLWAPEM